ncbi:MAG TPA: excinuclease ABC subunit UvrC [Phycisphaerae bacterium]|nr:excinuclease ABC subunit UvrC [Phycisphaerae bacterium]HRY70809.1 excinuclease ABC subunit UvrC [Phycisphaerae bacterium]HSA28314.1 excinuclease ABC subunit UvrC [Phycisphaerae bacterium]
MGDSCDDRKPAPEEGPGGVDGRIGRSRAGDPQGAHAAAGGSFLAKLRHLPKSPGVYLFKDVQGRVLYVGKAKDLRSRVSSYFQGSADLLRTRGPQIVQMVSLVADIDFLDCETEVDALLTESRLIKDIQPYYNECLRDDKTFPYLEITTSDDFPGVYITRKPRLKGSKLYGPFVGTAGLREAVNALQKVFRFRTCEMDIVEGDESRRHFRPCLLHAIKRCSGPCAALVSRDDYRQDIERFKKFLASKRSVVLRQLQKEMEDSATAREYEKAARLRDQLRAMESLSLAGDPETHVQPEVFHIDPRDGLAKLTRILELEQSVRTIEGIDIANLQGGESCGSLVCFIDGKPFKSGYRRFKIRTVEGIDDCAMIREVINRRYRYAAMGEELYPDVILIDGGLGQLHAAQAAFADMDIRPPMVVSLAKRDEELFIQVRSQPIRLQRNDPALRLLQQVRDEAHRFAQHYHHILRRKKVFEEDVAAGKRPPTARRRAGGRPGHEGNDRR